MELLKLSRGSGTQKKKRSKQSRSRSRSPVTHSTKKSNVDDTIDLVLQMGAEDDKGPEISPHSGDGEKKHVG